MKMWKVKVLVTLSCLTLSIPVDCSLPDSSVHGILQARTLESIAVSLMGVIKAQSSSCRALWTPSRPGSTMQGVGPTPSPLPPGTLPSTWVRSGPALCPRTENMVFVYCRNHHYPNKSVHGDSVPAWIFSCWAERLPALQAVHCVSELIDHHSSSWSKSCLPLPATWWLIFYTWICTFRGLWVFFNF